MEDYKNVIEFFALEEYISSCSENQLDDIIVQKIKTTINESIQYHNYLIGNYSRYPGLFSNNYLLLIVEHINKGRMHAVVKSQLSYTAYLFSRLANNSFSINLYRYGSSTNYFIVTESINPISNDCFTRNMVENNNYIPVYTDVMRFANENQLPKIKDLGGKTLEKLLNNIQHHFSHEISTKHHENCGINKVDVYLLGSNVDQFFYIHTSPNGKKLLYKYNLLEGWFCEVDQFDSATKESKSIIKDYIISRLTQPQYILEFEVLPYIYVQPVIEKHDPLPDDVVNSYPQKLIKQYARMMGVTEEEMKKAFMNNEEFSSLVKSAFENDTPLSNIIHAIKKVVD
jgi:hypothetical protein